MSMSIIPNRKPKDATGAIVDPAGLYVALDSHVSAAGSYKEGQPVRGSDPGVRLNPHLFVPDGLSDEERHVAHEAYAGPALDAAVATLPTSIGPIVQRPTSPDGFVVAKADIPPTFAPGGPYAPIPAGTLASASSPVVKARPKSFRPATEADLAQQQ
jgi:hypothetical protein